MAFLLIAGKPPVGGNVPVPDTSVLSSPTTLNNLFGLPHKANNAALSAVASTTYPVVVRDGFAAVGDSPPLAFVPSNSACSQNSGAGDGGSQVPSADGKCWRAQFPPGPLSPSWFGIFGPPLVFNVDGINGDDFSGANYCLGATPCRTAVQGLAKCFEFQLFNGGLNQYVLATGGTYNETLNWDVAMISAPGTAGETDGGCGFTGATNTVTSGGVGDTILAGDANQCGVAIATSVGSGWLRNVKVTALNNVCQSGIYTQEGGHMQIFDGVTTGPASVCKILSEENGSQLNTWNSFQDIGDATYFDCLSNKGQLVINGNQTITETGTPTYSVAYWSLTGNADIQIGGGTVFTGAISGLLANMDTGGMVRNNTSGPVQWPHTTLVPILRSSARIFPETADPICTIDANFGSTGVCFFNQKGVYSGQMQITPGGVGIGASGTIELTLPMRGLPAAGSSFPVLGQFPHGWPAGFTISDAGFTSNADGSINWFLGWTAAGLVAGTPVFINYEAGG